MVDYRGSYRTAFNRLVEEASRETYSVIGVDRTSGSLIIMENPTGRSFEADPKDRWNTNKWKPIRNG